MKPKNPGAMLIAEQKERENIAEYILYMWQMEDLIRGSDLNINKVMGKIFPADQLSDEMAHKYRLWFQNIIEEMKRRGIEKQGHLGTVSTYMKSLDDLHRSLLTTFQDRTYMELYREAGNDITFLRSKSNTNSISDIEVCLVGLYGLMLLRIRKAKISQESLDALEKIRKMIAHLSDAFNKLKNGELRFPREMSN